jgi:hypothetical protein
MQWGYILICISDFTNIMWREEQESDKRDENQINSRRKGNKIILKYTENKYIHISNTFRIFATTEA